MRCHGTEYIKQSPPCKSADGQYLQSIDMVECESRFRSTNNEQQTTSTNHREGIKYSLWFIIKREMRGYTESQNDGANESTNIKVQLQNRDKKTIEDQIEKSINVMTYNVRTVQSHDANIGKRQYGLGTE